MMRVQVDSSVDVLDAAYVAVVKFGNNCGVSICPVNDDPEGPLSVMGVVLTDSVDARWVLVHGRGVLPDADRYGELRVFPEGLGAVLAAVAGLPVFVPGEGFVSM